MKSKANFIDEIGHSSGIFLCWKQPMCQLVFTLHRVALSFCISARYECEEASRVFTGLHRSSPGRRYSQQGVRADTLIWFALMRCEEA